MAMTRRAPELRHPGSPPLEEIPQQRRVFGAHCRFHRWPCRQRSAPTRQFRLAGQNAEIADAVEHVEITEHGPEDRIDQREPFSVEPRRSCDPRLEPRKARL